MTDKLIQALQNAEGGSRELDAEIAAGIQRSKLCSKGATDKNISVFQIDNDYAVKDSVGTWAAPKYTTSVDAALTLVADSHGIETSKYWTSDSVRHSCRIAWGISGETRLVLDAHSLPLAICISALKAREGL